MVSFTLRPLYPGKIPRVPIGGWRLDVPKNWSGLGGEEKDYFPVQGIEAR
jgi:hypothetical protein